MFTTKSIQSGLPSEKTTPLNRLIGLSLGIIHIPSALTSLFLTFLAFFAWPILPVVLPLAIGGFYLFANYWNIYRDKASFAKARRIWDWSRNANLLLGLGCLFSPLFFEGEPWAYNLLISSGFMLFTAFLSHVAGKDLLKNQA